MGFLPGRDIPFAPAIGDARSWNTNLVDWRIERKTPGLGGDVNRLPPGRSFFTSSLPAKYRLAYFRLVTDYAENPLIVVHLGATRQQNLSIFPVPRKRQVVTSLPIWTAAVLAMRLTTSSLAVRAPSADRTSQAGKGKSDRVRRSSLVPGRNSWWRSSTGSRIDTIRTSRCPG